MSDQWSDSKKFVATWLSIQDFELLRTLSEADNVSVAAYIRAILVDAIQDQSTINHKNILDQVDQFVV